MNTTSELSIASAMASILSLALDSRRKESDIESRPYSDLQLLGKGRPIGQTIPDNYIAKEHRRTGRQRRGIARFARLDVAA
jgi:hypothetical protein